MIAFKFRELVNLDKMSNRYLLTPRMLSSSRKYPKLLNPTVEIRIAKGLTAALRNVYIAPEFNNLRPVSGIPEVFERPVPLGAALCTNITIALSVVDNVIGSGEDFIEIVVRGENSRGKS